MIIMMLLSEVGDVETNGSPPQLMELNVNDHLHLQADSNFQGTSYLIQF